MGVIIGLRPACRASLLHRYTPIKATFRLLPPIEIVDLLSSSNRVFILGSFAPGTNCGSAAEYAAERGVAQRSQSLRKDAYA